MNTQIINDRTLLVKEFLENILEKYKHYPEPTTHKYRWVKHDLSGENLTELSEEIKQLDDVLLNASWLLNNLKEEIRHTISDNKRDEERAIRDKARAEELAKEEVKQERKRQHKRMVARFNPARLIELPEIIVDEIATYLSTKQEVKRWKRTWFNGGYNDEYCPAFKWTYEWGNARQCAINLKWQNDYLEQAVLTLTRMGVPDLKLMFKKFKCLGLQGTKQQLVEQLIHTVSKIGKIPTQFGTTDSGCCDVKPHRIACLTLLMAGRKLAEQKNKGCVLVKEDKEKNADAKRGWMYIDERTKLDADRYNH